MLGKEVYLVEELSAARLGTHLEKLIQQCHRLLFCDIEVVVYEDAVELRGERHLVLRLSQSLFNLRHFIGISSAPLEQQQKVAG